MPEKILELLENGSLTEWQISEKLDISIEELKACMEYLQNTGFIRCRTVNPRAHSCSGNCGNCGGACNDSSNSSYIVWEVV